VQRIILALGVLAVAGTAAARPPPEPEAEVATRPMVEWSTWFRAGYGSATAPVEPVGAVVARTIEPARARAATWDVALGADATLPISNSGDLRVGPWIELRDDRVIGGGEIVLGAVPKRLDLFHFVGSGIFAVRIGGTSEVGTASIAYGYSAPWRLWGPWRGVTRYMIGVRFVGTVTRAHDDPADWKATVGIEVEPIGALRYVLGLRSLY